MHFKRHFTWVKVWVQLLVKIRAEMITYFGNQFIVSVILQTKIPNIPKQQHLSCEDLLFFFVLWESKSKNSSCLSLSNWCFPYTELTWQPTWIHSSPHKRSFKEYLLLGGWKEKWRGRLIEKAARIVHSCAADLNVVCCVRATHQHASRSTSMNKSLA